MKATECYICGGNFEPYTEEEYPTCDFCEELILEVALDGSMDLE